MEEKKLKIAILFFYAIDFGGKIHPFSIDEINLLKKRFDHVHLISLKPQKKFDFKTMVIPNGVFIHYINRLLRFFPLHALLSKIVTKEMREAEFKGIGYIKQLARTVLPGFLMYKIAKKIIKSYSTSDYIILDSYWMDCSSYGAALTKLKFPNSKFVCRVHGKEVNESRNEYASFLMKKFVFEQADYMLPVSDDCEKMMQKIIKKRNINRPNIKVLHLGVDRLFNVCEKASSKTFKIVSCSRIIPLKRVDLIADSLACIKDRAIEWIHFGNGIDEEKVKKSISCIGSNVKVVLKGNCNNEEIHAFYSSTYIDLFINVSTTEGIPVSIMEALSYGIPVMATNVGGTSEIVNYKNGILLNPNISKYELASEIMNYINEDESTKGLKRKNALNTWERHFNKKTNGEAFLDLL